MQSQQATDPNGGFGFVQGPGLISGRNLHEASGNHEQEIGGTRLVLEHRRLGQAAHHSGLVFGLEGSHAHFVGVLAIWLCTLPLMRMPLDPLHPADIRSCLRRCACRLMITDSRYYPLMPADPRR